MFILIGLCDYFGFGFITLSRKYSNQFLKKPMILTGLLILSAGVNQRMKGAESFRLFLVLTGNLLTLIDSCTRSLTL